MPIRRGEGFLPHQKPTKNGSGTKPRSWWPNPNIRYGTRPVKGRDYNVPLFRTNSFERTVHEPIPKGGFPKNTPLTRSSTNSRRGG